MSKEVKYLMIPAGAVAMLGDSLEEEHAKLRADGFEFTGEIENIQMTIFFKVKFEKEVT